MPCLSCAPYAAITFQRAPPEVNGFGVITSTPSLVRSSQVWMFFGLPLRTTNTTTESTSTPLYWPLVPVGVDEPGVDLAGDVRLEREVQEVGVWPASTARLWSPDEPYDWLKSTSLPSAVFWKAGISSA